MPLTMAEIGEEFLVKKISGKEAVRRFLESLGFVAGVQVSVIAEISGNIIVQVRGARVAVGREAAQKIIV